MPKKPILQLHTAVFLFGFAGLLGKLITMSPVVIVFGRTILAAIVLFIILRCQGEPLAFPRRRVGFGFTVMGVLLAVHWLGFFKAVQVSTVAIGLLTYASFPVFVTLIEPVVLRTGLQVKDIFSAAAVMTGLLIIIPEFNFSNQIAVGVYWGILSGFSFALLTVLNKFYSSEHSSLKIAFYQNSIAAVILLPFFLIAPKDMSAANIGYILMLGVFCTALAHTLFINSMRQVRAFTAGIAAALEPVYGIVLAFVILQEIPSLRTVIGGVVILATVGMVSFRAD